MISTKKVLNLYAGIGGNRKLWGNVEVTAVELNPEIAAIYQDFFPDDTVIIADAHEYLLEHFKDGWDYIWLSPKCLTHSRTNIFLNAKGIVRYPDIKLYEEILFLTQFAECYWVLENVIPYYEPLIPPEVIIDRHYFWSNYPIPKIDMGKKFNTNRPSKDDYGLLQSYHDFDLSNYNNVAAGVDHDYLKQLLRNCTHHKLGQYIFDCAFKHKQNSLLQFKEEAPK